MIKFYQITATVSRKKNDYRVSIQVPTFYLNANVQGIISEKHAATIARDMLLSVNPDAIVSAFALEF